MEMALAGHFQSLCGGANPLSPVAED